MRIRTLLALTLWMGFATVVSAQQAAQDRGVQRTAGNTGGAASTAAATPTTVTSAVIGSIDLDLVFEGYEKVKASTETMQAKILAKQNELQKMVADMKAAAEKQASLSPTSPEYKKFDQQLTQMKIEGQAFQENVNKEFDLIQAEALAEIYRDIQGMTARVAYSRGMNYVVKISNKPIKAAEDPNSVMAAISRTVVYSDPRNDITQQVVQYLNIEYRKTAGAAARPATNNAAPAAAAAQPATTRGN